MKPISNFIFEALFLKQIPRSGYQFLGVGRESVAEHVYAATLIAFVLSRLEPRANVERLLTLCLLHDLPEARTGDMNYVQKRYVQTDEKAAMADTLSDLPFGQDIAALLAEFNAGTTLEAKLARDADQLALLVDLKSLQDIGYRSPQEWLPHVVQRLQTQVAQDLAQELLRTPRDQWWFRLFY